MEQERPSYVTISSFLKNIIAPNHLEIFSKIIKTVIRYFGINIDDVFLDGSKFEANANKYKFVRKPTTFHLKLDLKIKTLLEKYICIPTNKKSFGFKRISAGDLPALPFKTGPSTAIPVSRRTLQNWETAPQLRPVSF